MNKFRIQGGEITIINFDSLQTIEKLDPTKCYLLNYNAMHGYYYLTVTENLELPPKVYGDKSHLAKYIKKYNCIDRNMGVLLSGIKGDGKSVDAKILAIEAKQPIIIINSGYTDQTFLEFASNPLFDNCTFFVDEFEKVYASNNPEVNTVNILKLLDGYSNNKNLFIFTSNEMNISKYLINRPSRIRYIKEYKGLTIELISEIIKDKLTDKSLIENTIITLKEYPLITMDILMEIINDINDLNISCEEAIKDLNFNSAKTKLNLTGELLYKGKPYKINLGQHSLISHIELFESESLGLWLQHNDFKDFEESELFVEYPSDKKFIELFKEEFSKNYPDNLIYNFNCKGFDFEIKIINNSLNHFDYIRAF